MNDSFIIIIGSAERAFLANLFRISINLVFHDAVGLVTAARCKHLHIDCNQNGRIFHNFLRMCEFRFDVVAFVLVHGLPCSKASAPYCSRSQISLITWREALSVTGMVYTCSISTSAKVRATLGKNDANIKEMMEDGGFGFHAKIK